MRWLLLVVVAGCTTDDDHVAVDAMATLDVIITPSGLTIHAASRSADLGCVSWFPAPGTTVRVGGYTPTCDPSPFACVEHVTYVGMTYTAPTTNEPLRIPSPPSGPTLELEGCGVAASVALPIVTLPSPPTVRGDITYEASNRVIDVAWETDPRATTHLVTLGTDIWAEIHHVDRDNERFTTPYLGSLSTTVQALLPGREHITSLGLVRVWPGSEPTTSQLQAVPRL